MRNSLKNLINEHIYLQTMGSMVDVYGQVAATNLRKIKADVVNSRTFMDGLRNMFQEIKSAWEQRQIASTVLPHNNKEVAVFVSANLGFYGDIVEKTYSLFAEYLKSHKVDSVIVVGREGATMVRNRLPKQQFTLADFPDDHLDTTSLKSIVDTIKSFERITLFHGKYASTITQEVVATKLEGSPVETWEYIFEPNSKSIVELFEGEILSSIVEQALREGQLSKFAARIMHLGEAIHNIEDKLAEVKIRKQRVIQDSFNKKQRTRLVSVRLLQRI